VRVFVPLQKGQSILVFTSPDGTKVLIKDNCWEKFIGGDYTLEIKKSQGGRKETPLTRQISKFRFHNHMLAMDSLYARIQT